MLIEIRRKTLRPTIGTRAESPYCRDSSHWMATTFRCLYCTFRNIAGRRTNQRTLSLSQATASILACCGAKSQHAADYLLSECSGTGGGLAGSGGVFARRTWVGGGW